MSDHDLLAEAIASAINEYVAADGGTPLWYMPHAERILESPPMVAIRSALGRMFAINGDERQDPRFLAGYYRMPEDVVRWVLREPVPVDRELTSEIEQSPAETDDELAAQVRQFVELIQSSIESLAKIRGHQVGKWKLTADSERHVSLRVVLLPDLSVIPVSVTFATDDEFIPEPS